MAEYRTEGISCSQCASNAETDPIKAGGDSNTGTNPIVQFFTGLLRILISIPIFIGASLLPLSNTTELIILTVVYLLLGWDILFRAASDILHGKLFDENLLMSIATIGAFAIGAPHEAVGVMLFYQAGEYLQMKAVKRSRASVASAMDLRPEFARLVKNGITTEVKPNEVNVGDTIRVRAGERIPLDGIITSGKSKIDFSSLTGESDLKQAEANSSVLSGAVNKEGTIDIRTTSNSANSAAQRILTLVEEAAEKKAPTERFITRFSRVYTPIVVALALILAIAPPLLIEGAAFNTWIYRALVFLVISCPCALVLSIPLSYFAGIGVSGKHGILVKGGNVLDTAATTDHILFDKTGTLSSGKFLVNAYHPVKSVSDKELLHTAATIEQSSNHPIARSISKAYGQEEIKTDFSEYREIHGRGIYATYQKGELHAGNDSFFSEENIQIYETDAPEGSIHFAKNKQHIGSISLADSPREGTEYALKQLKELGIKHIAMLTGDKKEAAEKTANLLEMDTVHWELLPQDKVQILEQYMENNSPKNAVMAVGDGINDAPLLMRADIGVAMGGVGSDAALESADAVLMNDSLASLPLLKKIALKTKRIVIQNIIGILGLKIAFLILGALGIAGMWQAVFADTGIALLAVLNSLRIFTNKHY